ncbi:MAG: hypothetical protein LC135_16705 [Phycisphaerae bacterium]|nr:hypothetical protein [Phycisphaerae bacterium]MCZ2401481.1 hypothetical protein [Phycisphaerae bacterium]
MTHAAALATLLVLQACLAAWFLSARAPGTDAAWSGLPLDDAWIHLVYGRSLAHHGLPYYNVGQLEAGFTSPLWAVVAAVAVLISDFSGLPVAVALKLLCLLSGIALTLGVYELTRALAGGVLGPLVAGLLTVLTPGLVFAQLSGMEVSLAAALSAWGLRALRLERHRAAGLLLGLAVITRPELVLLVGCAIAAAALFSGPGGAGRLMRLAWLAAPTVVLLALWAAYCLAVSGHPLPNTFYAKFSLMQQDHGPVDRLREMFLWLPLPFLVPAAALWIAAAVLAQRWRSDATLAVLAGPWVMVAGLALTRDFPPGSAAYFYWLRYVLPVAPLLYVPVAVACELLSRQLASGRVGKLTGALAGGALAAGLLWRLPLDLPAAREAYAWNCQNIEEVQVAVGRWIAANTPPGAVVVVNDAGAICYFGGRRTIDLIGLNYHPLALDKPRLIRIVRSATELRQFMQEQRADYLAVFPKVFAEALDSPEGRRFFIRLHMAQSAHYTVAPTDAQDVKVVMQRVR